jgi:rRNA maturation endonuclease Nob1
MNDETQQDIDEVDPWGGECIVCGTYIDKDADDLYFCPECSGGAISDGWMNH